jgi:predicted acyltransferase
MSATLVPPSTPGVPGAFSPPAPGTAPTTPAAAPARERLLSLDVFRGLTVAGMLLVNNPGSWAHIYPPLEHAAWHGWTPTDLIFPFFLFIVGITTELSFSGRRARGASAGALARQVVRRGGLIFLFGLLLSAFPFFQWGDVPGVADPSFADRVLYRLEHLRVMGVLQRIGLAYLVAGLLTLRTTWRQQVAVIAALLLGYWALVALAAVPPTGLPGWQVWDRPGTTVDAWLDRLVLTPDHLWIGGGGLRDPEGLLSTVPAVASVLIGVLAGRWIGQQRRSLAERLNGLFAVGALGMVAGLVWHWVFPINKNLWTSSYALFTGALACVALATCMWLIDVQKISGWTRPFAVYGTNPMLAFLGSGLMARLLYSILKVDLNGRPVSVVEWLYQRVYAPWLPPEAASLGFALTFVGFWYLVLLWCYRRGIVFRV